MTHRQKLAEKVDMYGAKIVKYRDRYGMTFPRIGKRWGKGSDWARQIYYKKKEEAKDET